MDMSDEMRTLIEIFAFGEIWQTLFSWGKGNIIHLPYTAAKIVAMAQSVMNHLSMLVYAYVHGVQLESVAD